MIFLNNAATTQQKPDSVKTAPPATEAEARSQAARLLGVKNPDNVVLTHSGTQAVELALRAFLKPGDHVIVSVTEQDRTWAVLEEMAASCGVELSTLDVNVYGILQYDTIEAMVKMGPKRIVYVSCDPATLARDITLLKERGYRVATVQAADLFPRCAHVETVCLLTKQQLCSF